MKPTQKCNTLLLNSTQFKHLTSKPIFATRTGHMILSTKPLTMCAQLIRPAIILRQSGSNDISWWEKPQLLCPKTDYLLQLPVDVLAREKAKNAVTLAQKVQ